MQFENNVTYQKAFNLEAKIVGEYKTLSSEQKEYVMSKQLLRSGTSVCANIAESNSALSKADYSAKVSIAYKECRLETKFWLELLNHTDYLPGQRFKDFMKIVDEVARILYSIVRTTRFRR